MRALIKEEVNTQFPQILPQAVSDFANPVIEKNVTESVEVAVLTRSSSQLTATYEVAASLSEFELTKILIDKMEKNKGVETTVTKIETPPLDQTEGRKEGNRVKMLGPPEIQEEPSDIVEDSGMQQDQEFVTGYNDEQPANKDVTKADCFKKPDQVVHAEEPPTSFDELNDISFDFSAFVMNQLKILNLTQETLVALAFNLLKGTYKSITELEYHLEECSKATTERLDWHNPKNKLYSFDLRKPLSRYSTSVTKTKASTYDLKWIEDLGPKCQRFYWYASNLISSKDVYSRRRIIAVTRLKILKMYDYGHLEEIEVRQDDQKLYAFKEGDFKRLRLEDIEDILLLLVQQKLTKLTIDEQYSLNVALRYGLGYRQAALSKEVDAESREVRWWKGIRERSQATGKDNMTLSYFVSTHFRSKSKNKGKVPTEMELVLEQTQQGTSYEVSAETGSIHLLSRITKMIADIEDWYHGPSDAMHNPP
ncbi:hypothetical protein Tco_0676878 [Tanacetum coccineum]